MEKVFDEGGLTNLEVQVAGGEEGRATTTGLQVTSETLSMNSELQVGTDLQATPGPLRRVCL